MIQAFVQAGERSIGAKAIPPEPAHVKHLVQLETFIFWMEYHIFQFGQRCLTWAGSGGTALAPMLLSPACMKACIMVINLLVFSSAASVCFICSFSYARNSMNAGSFVVVAVELIFSA